MKYCIDCKWYCEGSRFYPHSMCEHPDLMGECPVKGKYYSSPEKNRMFGECGESAVLFSQKTPTPVVSSEPSFLFKASIAAMLVVLVYMAVLL